MPRIHARSLDGWIACFVYQQVVCLQLVGGPGSRYHGGNFVVKLLPKWQRDARGLRLPASDTIKEPSVKSHEVVMDEYETTNKGAADGASSDLKASQNHHYGSDLDVSGIADLAASIDEIDGGFGNDEGGSDDDSDDSLDLEIQEAMKAAMQAGQSEASQQLEQTEQDQSQIDAVEALVSTPATDAQLEHILKSSPAEDLKKEDYGKGAKDQINDSDDDSVDVDDEEEEDGHEGWQWRRAYTISAHLVAPRCIAVSRTNAPLETSEAAPEQTTRALQSRHRHRRSGVLVAAADSSGVISVTDLDAGVTRSLPANGSRGTVVAINQQVRDQRIVKLAFGSARSIGGGGELLLIASLACGDVHLFDALTLKTLGVFTASDDPNEAVSGRTQSGSGGSGTKSFSSLFQTGRSESRNVNLAPPSMKCVLAEILPLDSNPPPHSRSNGDGAAPKGDDRCALITVSGSTVRLDHWQRSVDSTYTTAGANSSRVSSVKIGKEPILCAVLVRAPVPPVSQSPLTCMHSPSCYVLAVSSKWIAYLVSVAPPPGSKAAQHGGSSNSSSSSSGMLQVLGCKQLALPGGPPPWELFSETAEQLTYDKKVTAEGGTFQVDDGEAEAGGPGQRVVITSWGELLCGAHGSGEVLRLPVIDWGAFLSASPLAPSLDASDSSPSITLSANAPRLYSGPVLRFIHDLKDQIRTEDNLSDDESSDDDDDDDDDSASNGKQYESMARVGSETTDISPPHPPEPVDMASIAAAAIAEVAKDEQSTSQIVANFDEANVPPPPMASTSSPEGSQAPKRRSTAFGFAMRRFTFASSSNATTPVSGSTPSSSTMASSSPSPPKSAKFQAEKTVVQMVDLDAIFDSEEVRASERNDLIARREAQLRSDLLGGDSAEAEVNRELLERSGKEDGAISAEELAAMTPEQRTKLLLEQRGKDLKRLDKKVTSMSEAAQGYREFAKQSKDEAKKASRWPF